jgi:hypothetical protein
MKELVFLLEEPSAKAMIEGILPNIILEANINVRYIVFEGKQDLEKQITRKLQGYNNPNAIFIILRDQDSGDCKVIKTKLQQKCQEANKFPTIVRIVVNLKAGILLIYKLWRKHLIKPIFQHCKIKINSETLIILKVHQKN